VNARYSLLTLALLSGVAHAAPAASSNPAQQEQQNLSAVRQQIDSLQKDIAQKQAVKKEAQNAISASEQAIAASNKALGTLSQRKSASARQLAELKAQLASNQQQVKATRDKVARMLAEQYKRGDHDAMQLMFNASDPNQAARDLTYYQHIAAAQKKLIEELNAKEQQLAAMVDQLNAELDRLGALSNAKSHEISQLEQHKAAKLTAVSQLSSEIKNKQTHLAELKADEKRMTELIARINREIAERKREAARKAAAEKKAREEARKAAEAQHRKEVAEARKQGKTPPPAPKPVKEPKVETVVEPDSDQGLKGLSGKMPLPVNGQIVGRFGTPRSEGTTWKGIFIHAEQGQPVHAVASGRVVYADRLRGFGNAVIVDHGQNYMTVYTGLASIGKSASQLVKAGDTLGSSGALDSGEAGLYFEVRHLGQPINPMTWTR
jgi:septal ring factor EnvC (AmiA/AmiB activator)